MDRSGAVFVLILRIDTMRAARYTQRASAKGPAEAGPFRQFHVAGLSRSGVSHRQLRVPSQSSRRLAARFYLR